MSVFPPPVISRHSSTMAHAASRTAAVVALSAADFLAALAVNNLADPQTRESLLRHLPGASAVVVFATLTGALAVRTPWARTATLIASYFFSSLTAVVLIIEVSTVAAGTSPMLGGAGYFLFRCGLAVAAIVVYLSIIIVLQLPSRRVPRHYRCGWRFGTTRW
jgi:hypothetical protein